MLGDGVRTIILVALSQGSLTGDWTVLNGRWIISAKTGS